MSESKLTIFTLRGSDVPVEFVETQTVKDGVKCDIYNFVGDSSKDLGMVRVLKGYKTPLQRILLGEKTIEGFYDGVGTLTVRSADGQVASYSFKAGDNQNNEVAVSVGQTMQWHADGDSDLTFYEICEPPYEDGRFENLNESE